MESVTNARYLGVDISGSLSWNPHVDRITGNANRSLGVVRWNIKTRMLKVLETAYNTLVRPLEYASAVWHPHTKVRTSQIEQVQRRAARWTVSNCDWQASATNIVQDLGWRTLEQRRADVHWLVTVPLPDYIQYSNRISRYCHSMTFRQVSTSHDYYKYSFFPPRNSTVERPPTIHCMLAEPRGFQDRSLQAATLPPTDPYLLVFIWF